VYQDHPDRERMFQRPRFVFKAGELIVRDDQLVAAPTGATHVVAHSRTGSTTNLPLDDVRADRAWVVWDADGSPLTPEHGGPVRLLVPHLYFWKSAKWLRRIQFTISDHPGFWEVRGYHNNGDPWLEERYG